MRLTALPFRVVFTRQVPLAVAAISRAGPSDSARPPEVAVWLTRYRVAEPGHFSQSARGVGIRLCGTSQDVASPGSYTATCRLSARARQILRTRSIRATVTSTYTRLGLPTAIATVRVTIPRSRVVPPVTG